MDKQNSKTKVRMDKNQKIKVLATLVTRTMTLSRAGTVTRKGTHKLNAVLESEKTNL